MTEKEKKIEELGKKLLEAGPQPLTKEEMEWAKSVAEQVNTPFKEGDYVRWDVEKTGVPIGKGWIRGIASKDLPVLRRMWIIEFDLESVEDFLSELDKVDYMFTCGIVAEIALNKK
jgi:hypothetical protein